MALTYDDFLTYPLHIVGIIASYDDELEAIEELVVSEIDYSGDAEDIADVVPYFVFYKFCEDKGSQVTTSGETHQVAEFTLPSLRSQIRAWNIGAKKLLDICTENETTANENYQSQISMI